MTLESASHTQADVTKFYDELVFPSETSHTAYQKLVPKDLQGKKVGDFGCGQSLFLNVFRQRSYDAIFIDISPNVIRRIDYGSKLVGSLTNIPLADNNMDAIFCIGAVHHIPDLDKAIAELLRVLRIDGKLYLGVYAHRTVQSCLRTCYDRIRFSRPFVRQVSKLLIWVNNASNGLRFNSPVHLKRIEDLLNTPVVRYLPAKYYTEIVERYQGHIIGIDRISQMNILIARKG